MDPSHQGVRDGSASASPNRQFRSSRPGDELPELEDKERGQHFLGAERRGPSIYDEYTNVLRAQGKKSLASYDSWAAGSQAHKISTSASAFGSKPERFMSPYGGYDMDDSSFFAHTTRLNIVGPNSSSMRFLRPRSASMERLLVSCGERTMVTTATQKTESLRSLSPPIAIQPALAPEKHTSPTESYMKLSLQSSLPLEDPTASRKLLVLDLNGTLLLRSTHSGRRAPPPSYPRVRHSADTLSQFSPTRLRTTPSSVHPFPAPRTIYPRPYIPSFCAYLFHPTTLQWLDTMVWSSAQPHSVNDMVEKCFGTYKEQLKAIWARDTLGLRSDEYFKKTQTTKDLAKPWAQIPSIIPNPSHSQSPPESLSASKNSSSEVEVDSHVLLPQQQQEHSALTTILMDDSPLKAVLQPWNHLCVSEYEAETRKSDIDAAERELKRMWLAERERAKESSSLETTADGENRTGDAATNEDMAIKSSEENDLENKEAERKRKRKEKKFLKKEKLLLAKEQQLEAQAKEDEGYDATLLAVIGILDRLKHEGNVAGWMRSGGLIHAVGDQEKILESNAIDGSARTHAPLSENAEAGTTVTTRTRTTTTIPIPHPPTTITPPSPSTKRDGSIMSIRGPSKRRRLTHVIDSSDAEMDPVSVAGERALELDSDSEMTTTSKRSSSSPPPPSSPLSSAQALMGVPSTHFGSDNSLSKQSPTLSQPPPLWYETPSTLSHWAQHGRRALAELGIEIISGVAPPSQNGNYAGGQSSGGV
ncbi:hypothetical protein BYT27DRAFT_7241486 [Phlegmacium glaucopus]|nr:hypothetical protein BYT27DRAFT_7241486 [Phlegmacium glaucopus]